MGSFISKVTGWRAQHVCSGREREREREREGSKEGKNSNKHIYIQVNDFIINVIPFVSGNFICIIVFCVAVLML